MKYLIVPALATLLLSTPALCACEPEIAFPVPRYNKTSLEPAFAAIRSDLAQIESLNATFYSIEVASSKDTLFQQHHVENTPTNASSSSPADALIYRAGSQTKLFTALAVLQQAADGKISLDHSICDYYAGDLLRDDECNTVTVRALLAHVAGIRSNFVDLDLLRSLPDPSVIGLPAVTEVQAAEHPKCGAFANYTQPCGEQDLAQALVQSPPVFRSGAEVSYSNIGYELLGLAIENVTGMDYREYIATAITGPLLMNSTGFGTPSTEGSAVTSQSAWGIDMDVDDPAGGIYTTSHDMITFLQHALTHRYDILAGYDWLAPVDFNPGSHSYIGYPWEIFRSQETIANTTQRAVTYVTKGGGVSGYYSYSVIIPAYDLVIFMVVAGPLSSLNDIFDVVRRNLPSAAETIAQDQLAEGYAGTYDSTAAAAEGGANASNSSIILSHDPSKSLYISSWTSDSGTDVLAGVIPLIVAQSGFSPEMHFQLIPTFETRNRSITGNENETRTATMIGEVWRFINVQADEPSNPWADYCIGNIDALRYAGVPINEVVFWRGDSDAGNGNGNESSSSPVTQIEISAWGVVLARRRAAAA